MTRRTGSRPRTAPRSRSPLAVTAQPWRLRAHDGGNNIVPVRPGRRRVPHALAGRRAVAARRPTRPGRALRTDLRSHRFEPGYGRCLRSDLPAGRVRYTVG